MSQRVDEGTAQVARVRDGPGACRVATCRGPEARAKPSGRGEQSWEHSDMSAGLYDGGQSARAAASGLVYKVGGFLAVAGRVQDETDAVVMRFRCVLAWDL